MGGKRRERNMDRKRPILNPKIWVNVNHETKIVQFIQTEHKSKIRGGVFMTNKQFRHYREERDLSGYTIIPLDT